MHHRRSLRLTGYDYSQCGAYFVTICAHARICHFGAIVGAGSARPDETGSARPDETGSARPDETKMILNDAGKIIDYEWHNLQNKYPDISLHEYVIMPNHFHAILEIKTMNETGRGLFEKTNSGRANPGGRANPAPTLGNIIAYFKYQTTKRVNLPHKLWQRNYYEHIIRNEDDFRRIAEYIQTNPLHWRRDELWTSP